MKYGILFFLLVETSLGCQNQSNRSINTRGSNANKQVNSFQSKYAIELFQRFITDASANNPPEIGPEVGTTDSGQGTLL